MSPSETKKFILLTYESVIADGDDVNAEVSKLDALKSDNAVSSSGEVIMVVFTKS